MPLNFSSFSNPFQKSHKEQKEHKDSYSNYSLNQELKIGEPTNFKHNIQVKHDKERNQFIGLPQEWRALLDKNGIRYNINNIRLRSFFLLNNRKRFGLMVPLLNTCYPCAF